MSIDELLPEARELKREHGGLPSKDAIRKALRVRWDRAAEVHRQLSVEDAQEARGARSALRRLGARKNPRRPAVAARRPLPVSFPALAVGPLPEPKINGARVISEEAPAAEVRVFPKSSRRVATWPALVVAAPAAVAIWAGWVAIGKLTGFGKVNLLPGVGEGWVVDTAITLPIGVEAYAAYAFYVALNQAAPAKARGFAAWSSGLAVLLGMGGQTAYHLMATAGMTAAPWWVTTAVSCLPVAVFAVTAALVHMVKAESSERKD